MVGILGQNALQLPAGKQLVFIGLQVKNNLRAAVCFLYGFHAEFAIAFGFPFHTFASGQTRFARAHCHLVGHNEGRIEPNAKLTNQSSVLLLVTA